VGDSAVKKRLLLVLRVRAMGVAAAQDTRGFVGQEPGLSSG